MALPAIQQRAGTPEDPLDKVFTVSNVITFIRLCMIPVFFITMLLGYNLVACVFFAVAASTDWLDGQIARHTNTVSKLGRMLDPCVDRLLMIFGVLAVFLAGRVPLWIIVLILSRDIGMMLGYLIFLARYRIYVDVMFAGKVCTTLFFIGFAFLILNAPQIPGLGIVSLSWLPGLNDVSVSIGIWFIYVAILLCMYTTTCYIRSAFTELKRVRGNSND